MYNPFSKKKTLDQTVRGLTSGQLEKLMNELNFAIHFHEVGETEAKNCIRDQRQQAPDVARVGQMYHQDMVRAIPATTAYKRVASEMIHRGMWVSHLNPPSLGLDGTSEVIVRSALTVLYLRWYPRPLGGTIPDDEIAKSMAVIHSYGFDGIFVDWKVPYRWVDLEKVLLKAKL